MATDKEIVEQIRHGERDAYAGLFQKYQKPIYAICYSIVRDPQDAEDLTQEVFISAYLKLHQLRDPAKFFQWIKEMARNLSRNYTQRAKSKTIPMPLGIHNTVGWALPTIKTNPEEEILRQELIDAVMEAIEILPVKDRQIIKARIDGLSHTEISKRFDMSVQASMSRLYHIRNKLADSVKHLLQVLFSLPKMLHIKKIFSGGVMAMKVGTSAKIAIGIAGILILVFIGFQVVTRLDTDQIPKGTQQTRRITAPRFTRKIAKSETTAKDKNSSTYVSDSVIIPDEVPIAQSSDGEIRNFIAWLSSLDKDIDTKKPDAENDEKIAKLDYDREKSIIESVIWDNWKKGYESYDIEWYMSSIWEDDFFYTSDTGTPDNPSDDIILRGGQREREGAARVFRTYAKGIKLNISPHSPVEFLSDTMAMAEYDYNILFSKVPTPESKFSAIYASGNIKFILERRKVSKNIYEWRILQWYDYATPK